MQKFVICTAREARQSHDHTHLIRWKRNLTITLQRLFTREYGQEFPERIYDVVKGAAQITQG